ncbi:carboxymuconolactone decarboxylase family protein [Streptomyces tsukubensis]|uniref:DNA-binding protein n=1 Tax=Streptomyces tsukubensis TaxID=83656 RepID=A0A1V4ADZ0_9ACTN|nr:carboxymuconolactone decarboxylase family protein [Streptomyces tsukubensis]OON81716.1 DNA-binding protein [Streptomyces tsukubensis]QFR96493.1 DNA-binding protein [Streptomyces tsukubensis]
MAHPFRFTSPAPLAEATGATATLYAQIAEDFGIAYPPPLAALSPSPELLSATWALLRETLLAGDGSRTARQLIASGVSEANRCPFCVDAHALLLHATGERTLAVTLARGEVPGDPAQARLLDWGRATRVPGSPATWPLPFPQPLAPAYFGTALAFHFINRVVSALVDEELLHEEAELLRRTDQMEVRAVPDGGARIPVPGLSLPLLAGETGPAPAWATDTPVGTAYAALRSAALMGEGLLDDEDLALLGKAVAEWDGGHPDLASPGLPGRDRPGARLAALAALAPYRITAEDVEAWRGPHHTDHCLVHLIAYGAFAAVERIEAETWIDPRPAGDGAWS